MQLPGLIGFTSILILVCNSEGKDWSINVRRNITAQRGSTVDINCNFSYPDEFKTNNVTVYWKHSVNMDKSKCSKNDNDKRAFVFHPNKTCVLDKYKNNTMLIGKKDEGNCSLRITNVTDSESTIYVRIYVKGQNYSYIKQSVSITINGAGVTPATDNPDFTTPPISTDETTMAENSTAVYVAISVAVPAVIILLVAGIFICKKYKRSQSVTREESGYYANFRRALSNPPKREAACDTQDKKLPEQKVIDEPVYINVEIPPGHTDRNMDRADNIYANVDYTN